jgi:hypothetical protein
MAEGVNATRSCSYREHSSQWRGPVVRARSFHIRLIATPRLNICTANYYHHTS